MRRATPSALTHDEWPVPTERLAPERMVDAARGTEGVELRGWCSRIAESAEARAELDLMAAFDDEPGAASSRWAVEARLQMAVEGALATLDESVS